MIHWYRVQIITFLLSMSMSMSMSFIPSSASAAGIKCAVAKSSVDKTICSTASLRKLDGQLATLYAYIQAHQMAPWFARFFAEQQRSWIKDRDLRCQNADETCLVSAYQARILQLSILRDRIGTSALSDLTPVIMRGTWNITGKVEMLSEMDNPAHKNQNISLRDPGANMTDADIYFPAESYIDEGLGLPGWTVLNRPDGSTCFQGASYTPGDLRTTISADYCVRYGWIKTSLDKLSGSLPQPDPTRKGIPLGQPLGWLDYVDVAPTVMNDLKVAANAPVYIGFVRSPEDYEPSGFSPPVPTVLMIQGASGALYALEQIYQVKLTTGPIFGVGYQKWVPASSDARMEVLSTPGSSS